MIDKNAKLPKSAKDVVKGMRKLLGSSPLLHILIPRITDTTNMKDTIIIVESTATPTTRKNKPNVYGNPFEYAMKYAMIPIYRAARNATVITVRKRSLMYLDLKGFSFILPV